MKVLNYFIPIFKWNLQIVILNTKSDVSDLLEEVTTIDKIQETHEALRQKLSFGDHYYNMLCSDSKILIFSPDRKTFLGILSHEINHFIDRMLDHCRVKDTETRSYVTQYITELLYDDGIIK